MTRFFTCGEFQPGFRSTPKDSNITVFATKRELAWTRNLFHLQEVPWVSRARTLIFFFIFFSRSVLSTAPPSHGRPSAPLTDGPPPAVAGPRVRCRSSFKATRRVALDSPIPRDGIPTAPQLRSQRSLPGPPDPRHGRPLRNPVPSSRPALRVGFPPPRGAGALHSLHSGANS